MELLHANCLGAGGKPFIVLHGFLGMGDNWKSLAKFWVTQGYAIHLLDQRNHGRSFWSSEFSYPLLAEDVLRYMDYYGLENPIILGHSMGGKTAMTLATAFPDRVSKLIVADIAPKHYPPHHDQILKGLAALDFDKVKSRSEADHALANFITDAGTRQFLLKNLYWVDKKRLGLRINIEVLKGVSEAIGAGLLENSCFTGPALFLAGELSPYIQSEDHALIKKHFPQSTLINVPKAGHWLHAENPNFFSEQMLLWLD